MEQMQKEIKELKALMMVRIPKPALAPPAVPQPAAKAKESLRVRPMTKHMASPAVGTPTQLMGPALDPQIIQQARAQGNNVDEITKIANLHRVNSKGIRPEPRQRKNLTKAEAVLDESDENNRPRRAVPQKLLFLRWPRVLWRSRRSSMAVGRTSSRRLWTTWQPQYTARQARVDVSAAEERRLNWLSAKP